jgi:hypothetical protein
MAFSLEKFESLAYGRNREMGVRELLALLQDLDANYGQVGAQFRAQPLQSVEQKDMDLHVLNRVAAAASCLLSDPDLFSTPYGNPFCYRTIGGWPAYLQPRLFAMPTT